MKFRSRILSSHLALLALPLAACAADMDEPSAAQSAPIISGTPIDAPNSGIVRLRTAGCSGTLLDNQWVLTAAHCNSQVGQQVTTSGGQSRTVARVVNHPDVKYGVDIALLKLSLPMTLNGSDVGFHRLLRRSVAPAGTPVRCFGFGRTYDAPGTLATLRLAELETFGGGNNEYTFERNAQGQGVAPGDAGGPCIDGNGYELAALRSFIGSGPPSLPGETYAVTSSYYARWASDVLAGTSYQNDLVLLARGGDNAIWHKYFDSNGWSEWITLGGIATSTPAAVTLPDGRAMVFARGTDNTIQYKTNDSGWSEWTTLGGGATSAPAAAVTSDGTVWLFAKGTDNAIWAKTYAGGQWSGWDTLYGDATSAPAVAVNSDHRMWLFARGTDGGIWAKSYLNGQWTGWDTLYGNATSSPTAVARAGHVYLFAGAADTGIWWKTLVNGQWSDWTTLEGQTTGDPGAGLDGNGNVYVTAPGPDHAAWYRILDWEGVWSDWLYAGGYVTSGVAAM